MRSGASGAVSRAALRRPATHGLLALGLIALGAASCGATAALAQTASPPSKAPRTQTPASSAQARAPDNPTPARDPAFVAFLEAFWPKAQAAGIDRAAYDKLLAAITPDLTLPDVVRPAKPGPAAKRKRPHYASRQAEFSKTPAQYMATQWFETLVTRGQALSEKHAATLATVEVRLQVHRRILLAIWGRETAYGTYRLPHDGLRVLATQAFTGRRRAMYTREFLAALKLRAGGHASEQDLRSSWSGAIGLPQFMPSEWFTTAVDIDGDGRRNIWSSVPDALGSAANQLKQKGWKPGVSWGYEVALPDGVDCTNLGPQGMQPIRAWQARGIERTRGRRFAGSVPDEPAYLLMPAGAHGPSFLVTENFLTIKRYNPADLYALFVGHLADRIGGGAAFATPWKPIAMVSNHDIEALQRLMNRAGLPAGPADGLLGSKTRRAIGLYQKAHAMTVDCWPSAAVLAHAQARYGTRAEAAPTSGARPDAATAGKEPR